MEDIRNGNVAYKDNHWKKEKLLTLQELEITKMTPSQKLGI